MGELAHLKLFIEQATTALVVTTFDTVRVSKGRKNCHIEPGEDLSIDGNSRKSRFKLKLRTLTEAIMTGFINEIIDACIAYSKRAAGFTYPATMHHIKFVYTNKTFVEGEIWKKDIYIDVEWGTS